MRKESELPECTQLWGWRYHHLGVPIKDKKEGEVYVPHLKFYVSGFPDSPFGIEWMRFEADSPMPALIREVPHLAFEVDDVEDEILKHRLNVLVPVNSPSSGIKVAMIEHNGAPIELIAFVDKRKTMENDKGKK